MKELNNIVRAAVRVILTRRDAKRAADDGAGEAARKKYGLAFSKALDDLEKAVVALPKPPPTAGPPAAPFDWMGAFRAVQAIVRAAKKVKRGAPVEDVIEGEIV